MYSPVLAIADQVSEKQTILFQKCRSFAPVIDFAEDEIETSVVARFEKQVERYADHLAVKTQEHSLTYEALNHAANRLGRAVIEQIGKDEEPVAYMLPHGVEQIIAILGLLKAGKMYLPLDPSFPENRLAAMLADSQARLIVTGQENLELVNRITHKRIHIIDIASLDPSLSVANINLPIEPDRLLSLLYTSGTSGQPKGVVSNHRNLMHGMWSYTNHFGFCTRDRLALLLSTSFAASVSTVFGSLLNGATLLPFDIQKGLLNLKDWLLEEKITILMIVPTLFRHFAMSLNGEEKFPHLRLVSVGGEPVLRSDVELFKRNFSKDCILRNNLSGTEMGNLCNFLIDMSTEITDNVVPVGYSLGEKQVRLLDDEGNEVEHGELGEIVVRSRHLSPGYWQKPELTREKFQELPGEGGMRQYRTGDLGRMSPDGCLFHLGRKDFLVKIRGYRIELGEIEGVMTQHPAIRECVLVVQESKGFDKRLIAYILPDLKGPAVTDEELRIFLKKRLPDYMIPFAFVRLPVFPLTPTGKIDRLALPSLEKVLNLEQDYIPPRDEIESRLVQIWEGLLEVSPIGIRNDFFLIGGHSLLAARMIAQVGEQFGRRLDFASISNAATIEHLAEILRKDDINSIPTSLVPIRAKGDRAPLFCVHGVGGHILPFLQLASHLDSNQPVYGLQAKPVHGVNGEERTVEELASEYIAEIEQVQPVGPYHLAGFSFGGFLAYEMACQLMAKGQEVALLAILDSQMRGLPGYRQALSVSEYTHFRAKSLLEKSKYRLGLSRKQPFMEAVGVPGRQNHDQFNQKEAILGDVVDEEVPDHLKIVMQANIKALLKYVPKHYSGKLTLFKSLNHGQGVHYGWGELVRGGVEDHYVPGSHRGILQEPNVAILAVQVQGCIDRALEN